MEHKTVAFIRTECGYGDQVVSFELDEPGYSRLTLLRSPGADDWRPESELGVSVNATWAETEDSFPERELLRSIDWKRRIVRVSTAAREVELDISQVRKSDIQEAKEVLDRMNYDNRFTAKGL